MRSRSATLSLPLSQEDWRSAVRSFVGGEESEAFAVEVSIVADGLSTIASDSWASDARDSRDIAEGITQWIELRCESANTEHLEALISIWDHAPTRLMDYGAFEKSNSAASSGVANLQRLRGIWGRRR